MEFIEEFFYGNIDPQSRSSVQIQELKKVQKKLTDLEEQLTQQLTEPQRALFVAYTDVWNELNAKSDLDSFVTGFRMGAKMTLDTFGVN